MVVCDWSTHITEAVAWSGVPLNVYPIVFGMNHTEERSDSPRLHKSLTLKETLPTAVSLADNLCYIVHYTTWPTVNFNVTIMACVDITTLYALPTA